MSALVRRAGLHFVGCLLVLASAATLLKADEGLSPIKGLRVFSAGHSFHYFLPPVLTDIAAKAKIDGHVQVGLQAIGGSRVIQHWDVPDDRNKVKDALKTGKVDVLTLSPIFMPDEGIKHFAKLALEQNPAIRITVQESWMPFDDPALWQPGKRPKQVDRDAKTITELREAHTAYFESIDQHIRSLNEELAKQVLFIAPIGQAVLGLREKVIAGEAPGIKKQSELFTDAIGHAHPPIMVLEGYCYFAEIYRQSPVGLPVAAAIARYPEAEKLNRLLQELAWTAVTTHPLSGVKP